MTERNHIKDLEERYTSVPQVNHREDVGIDKKSMNVKLEEADSEITNLNIDNSILMKMEMKDKDYVTENHPKGNNICIPV